MTPKERAAMQQALIYLDAIINGEGVKPYQLEGTAFTLREALAEQAEQEPVATVKRNEDDSLTFTPLRDFYVVNGMELYAAPVRTKDLTDDELADACGWKLGDPMYEWVVDIGRWAIAADREKNK